MNTLAAVMLLLLLNGCVWTEELNNQCKREFGPEYGYNGIAKQCQQIGGVGPMMMPFMLNERPSPRFTPMPLTPAPMPQRCNSLVIGGQIQTTCF
jgi:hypothetical protein